MASVKDKKQSRLFDDLRSKAELFLQDNPSEARSIGAKDFDSLLHELEVQQVELAMQNEELLQSRAVIEESHRKYLDLYDFAPIGYLTYDDRAGRIIEINHAGAVMLGCEKGKAVGKKLTSFISSESQDEFYFHKKACFDTCEKQTCELTLQGKGHSPVQVQLSSMPAEPEGSKNLLRMALTDVSKHRLLEEKLRQSQKMEAMGALAGGIAHEFNNLLGGITNYTELAEAELPADSPEREYLDEALQLCKKARDVVRQILSYSHKHRIEKRPVAVQSAVAETVKLLRSSLPANIEIREDLDAQAGIVLGDRTQLQQVLINLCTNAAYAMKQTGGLLAIALKSVVLDDEEVRSYPELQSGAYIKLTVVDTGTGFDPAITERIFDPFFTTKKVGEGTGMGLAVVQSIVRNHGGAIAVASTADAGTTCTVLLPRPGAGYTASAEVQDKILPRGTERILLVDDEDFIVIPTKKMLENLGYRVTALTDSLESLELFRNTPDAFDLVITDLTMPCLTGDRLAAEIIKIRKDIPVAIATGYVNAADNEEVKKSGIKVVIPKPYRMQDLAKSIRYILDEK